MALATVVAGPYGGTWNSSSVGQQQDGFRLRLSFAKESVLSNTYGDSVIDSVYRGGNCFLVFTGIEYASLVAAAAVSPWNPYGGTAGGMGLVGRLDVGSSLAKVAVLTAVSGTTAAAAPATLTASNTIIDEALNTELLMASRHRVVPITFRCYPYDSGGSVIWFSVT